MISHEVPRQNKNVNDILEMAYEFAVSEGPNGFINLQYDIDRDEKITLSGLLIKLIDVSGLRKTFQYSTQITFH